MIKIKNAKFHNGKLDDESMKKVKESFGKDKMRLNKIVKLKKKEEIIEDKEMEVIVK